ncbi:Nucleotidyltransferase domain-containing protein [Desulfurobacterium pacificum]|uniref:Nucleotidyltransferase domain-containing protein n=1 Tax=Desulfurobacterium pacificum TaxID=240166 RepID=A0ABY1NDU7_9BACT|nr:nucleotidyltransferase domain-containing protein [Desulfurobacterium pacificum]SMP07308.1 Nucleotidyltransferase domain-containing protein [Desulfurobacterium pacificum]
MEKPVRLNKDEIRVIKETVLHFDPEAEIILFGSRTDLSKKGGDIDLLIVSSKIKHRERRKIRVELFKKLGDRKIDIVTTENPSKSAFTALAYKYGVKL